MMKGKRVGVIGAGRSGLAAARLLKRLGAKVLLSDSDKIRGSVPRGIDVESGRHSRRLLNCDLIIRSPGVPGHLPILERIRRQGIPIWSELELASRYTQARRLVAVTGTNGKTTTTTLIGEFFKNAGRKTFVAGNIGLPLSAVAAKTSPAANVVLEVSSYQLENIESFHPTASVILNITPDHLEHHGTMRAYADAKARIFENQSSQDVCVLNADDAWCRRLTGRCRAKIIFFSRKRKLRQGIYIDGHDLVIRWRHRRQRWFLRSNIPGPHNIENILAAVAVAVAAGIPMSTVRKVLNAFRGVEHRLELVRTLRGVRYINDSKGTNVDSTRVALLSFSDPLILIVGGEGKGSPYAPLKPLVMERVKRILLIGEDAPRIARELQAAAPMERLYRLTRAVKRAQQVAAAGDIVLLSPACASFDQYKNYEDRGRHFKTLVRGLR
jgi:UDP-N-acetylmuramoylalanine--D-glutamate ligase